VHERYSATCGNRSAEEAAAEVAETAQHMAVRDKKVRAHRSTRHRGPSAKDTDATKESRAARSADPDENGQDHTDQERSGEIHDRGSWSETFQTASAT